MILPRAPTALRPTRSPTAPNTARAEQSDAAGNSGQSAPVTFTIDSTPPGGPPPETTLTPVAALLEPLPDVTAPALRLAGKRTQKAGKRVKVTLTAISEDLWATAVGKLAVERSARRFKLEGVRAKFIAQGQTAALALKLPANVLSAARHALRSSRDVMAELRLSARDAAGNVTTKRRTIKLER